jgi:hypothetical protein
VNTKGDCLKKFLEDWGVTLCGAITSVLTAMVVLLIQKLTGFNLFTLSVWLVVPVGAGLTGFAAASGYMFGSLYFHHKPTKMLLLNMAVIAAGTQFLIYYLEYSTLVLNDGRTANEVVGFSNYLNVSLTTAKYSLTRTPHSGVEVGSYGYFLAFLQFLSSIIGGIFVYLNLKSKQMCEKCSKYYRTLAKKVQIFKTADNYKPYLERLVSVPPFSSAYIDCFSENHTEKKPGQGSMKLTFELFGCPLCKSQYVSEATEVFNGKDWKPIYELSRKILVSETQSLLEEFKKSKAA